MSCIHKTTLLGGLAIIAIMVSAPVFAETMTFKAGLERIDRGAGLRTVQQREARMSPWIPIPRNFPGRSPPAAFPVMPSPRTSIRGPAAAGENAGPVVDITAAIAKGSAEISDQQLADLQAGKWYVNIHTEKFPGTGEIRGQVEKAQ